MPELTNPYFGALPYAEEALIQFPLGLPGFPDEKQFLLVEQPFNRPLVFVQSVHRPDVCFITVPIRCVCPGYKLAIPADDLRALGFEEGRQPAIGSEILCLAVLVIGENKPPTVNLLSPIVVHWRDRRAVQVIPADSGYSHENPLFEEEASKPCS